MEKTDWTADFRDGARFWVLFVLTPIVVVVGLVGNGVTILVLTRKRMKSSTNVYLTALATADMFYLFFTLVLCFWHVQYLQEPEFLPLWQTWGVILWLADACTIMSVWMTVSFTLERYIAVCHPLRGRVLCTESRAKKVVLTVVVASLLITSTTPFEWKGVLIEKDGRQISRVEMTELAVDPMYVFIFHNLWIWVLLVVPFTLLLVLNYLLILAVRKSQRYRNTLTEDSRGVTGSIRRVRKVSSDEEDRGGSRRVGTPKRFNRERQENKITMALVSVVCLFLICQAPTAVQLTIKLFFHAPDSVNTPKHNLWLAANNVCNLLVQINATANFLLYCAMSDKYRETLYMIFCPSQRHKRSNTYSSVASFKNSTNVIALQDHT